jgi:hypothetical protein
LVLNLQVLEGSVNTVITCLLIPWRFFPSYNFYYKFKNKKLFLMHSEGILDTHCLLIDRIICWTFSAAIHQCLTLSGNCGSSYIAEMDNQIAGNSARD